MSDPIDRTGERVTHTKVLKERRKVAPRAEGRDAEIVEDIVLVLLDPELGDLGVGLTEVRSLVLARVPQRLGRLSRVGDVESSTLDEVRQRRRSSRVPLRARDGDI